MTKLWVLSDLHFDHGRIDLPVPDGAEIAVIAGDVVDDEWLAMIARRLPTVFVAGNHEYYGWEYAARNAALAEIPGLHFLNDSVVEIDGIVFAGATLWTDYGHDPAIAEIAKRGMNDHQRIRWGSDLFMPAHAQRLHKASVEFLACADPDVIVTHHAPSRKSVHQRFKEERHAAMNRAFYSDLDHLVKASLATLWIHGHMHNNADYKLRGNRVLCNPYGYPGENTAFDAALVVEVTNG